MLFAVIMLRHSALICHAEGHDITPLMIRLADDMPLRFFAYAFRH